MASDDQRREVAARMRKRAEIMRRVNGEFYARESNPEDCGNMAYRNIAASVEAMGGYWDGSYIHIVETLADLIDRPTCEMAREGEGFRCSACGEYHDMSGFEKFQWAFCPDCGVRVIHKEEDDG